MTTDCEPLGVEIVETEIELGNRVAGVDEVGRGPLAGPVVAAAVILDARRPIAGLADSKAISEPRRIELARAIRERALAMAVVRVEAAEIDERNILGATLVAMTRAVAALRVAPSGVLVDGNRLPELAVPGRAVVGGDGEIEVIGAASIVAKVVRDSIMRAADRVYPQYGFARHKGYPTAQHRDALQRFGPCALHRVSFSPVAQAARMSNAERLRVGK